jgi:hypothetical protein
VAVFQYTLPIIKDKKTVLMTDPCYSHIKSFKYTTTEKEERNSVVFPLSTPRRHIGRVEVQVHSYIPSAPDGGRSLLYVDFKIVL